MKDELGALVAEWREAADQAEVTLDLADEGEITVEPIAYKDLQVRRVMYRYCAHRLETVLNHERISGVQEGQSEGPSQGSQVVQKVPR